jgi:hypothetical protein
VAPPAGKAFSAGPRKKDSRRSDIELRTLLAGPVVRRVDARTALIWVATSEEVGVGAEVFRLDPGTGVAGPLVGRGRGEVVRLGARLFVHLIEATPFERGFPVDTLLGYDLVLEGEGEGAPHRLADLGLLAGPERLVYGNLPLPSFFIRERDPTLNVVHGSCRLLHGAGEDALISVDEILSRTAHDLGRRPCALFLTGDQIYADDVAGPLIGHLRELADELMGAGDSTSVPGTPSLDQVPVGGRKNIALERAKFTSDKAGNHLMSFGEFAAMYVTAWNRQNWPAAFPDPDTTLEDGQRMAPAALRARQKYRREVRDLERARAALGAVRRVLANTACYMTFDDHDVTDDWNLTGRWRENVKASPTGRRIVANALAAYWAFQGWGNAPAAYPDSWTQVVSDHLRGSGSAHDYETMLWSFDGWSFVAPTVPPTLVLDTRTQRAFDAGEGAARLVGPDERARLRDLVNDCGHDPASPLTVVSPVPVCGLELQERRQKFLVKQVGPYEIDFEAWQSNLQGFVDLMCFLVEELGLEKCLFLSGDVHYGLNLRFIFSIGERRIAITQLVSSGFKHSGIVSKSALNALGSLVRARHERVGWKRPPPVQDGRSWRRRVMMRAVNTDDWAEDAPVFLSPGRARQLKADRPPDFRELRLYVRSSGPGRSILVGENNAGLVRVTGDDVEHLLLSRSRNGTQMRAATIRYGVDDDEVQPFFSGEER